MFRVRLDVVGSLAVVGHVLVGDPTPSLRGCTGAGRVVVVIVSCNGGLVHAEHVVDFTEPVVQEVAHLAACLAAVELSRSPCGVLVDPAHSILFPFLILPLLIWSSRALQNTLGSSSTGYLDDDDSRQEPLKHSNPPRLTSDSVWIDSAEDFGVRFQGCQRLVTLVP
jgi:hypothetical protein